MSQRSKTANHHFARPTSRLSWHLETLGIRQQLTYLSPSHVQSAKMICDMIRLTAFPKAEKANQNTHGDYGLGTLESWEREVARAQLTPRSRHIRHSHESLTFLFPVNLIPDWERVERNNDVMTCFACRAPMASDGEGEDQDCGVR